MKSKTFNTKNIIISVFLLLLLSSSILCVYSFGDFFVIKNPKALICFICITASMFCSAFVSLPLVSFVVSAAAMITVSITDIRFAGVLIPVIALAFFHAACTDKKYIRYKIPAILLIIISFILFFSSLIYDIHWSHEITPELKTPFDYAAAILMVIMFCYFASAFSKSFNIQKKNTTVKKKKNENNKTQITNSGIHNFFFLCCIFSILCIIFQFRYCIPAYAKISILEWIALIVAISLKNREYIKVFKISE